ncbi:UNVERIFIED_CONTAM: hypothetical protein Sindi_1843600, partial [Sesamum indicum]
MEFSINVLYVESLLLIGNDVKILENIKAWFSTQFYMKDMSEASYILCIKIYNDRSKRMLGLTQSFYIGKGLKRFKMKTSKQGFLTMRHGIKLSKKQSPKTDRNLNGCQTFSMIQPWTVFSMMSNALGPIRIRFK